MPAPTAPTGKRATWAELFFDLVFVFAATQTSGLLHQHNGWPGVGMALVVFVPMYWGWVGTTVYANRRNVENTRDMLGLFGLGLAVFYMALAVPHSGTSRGIEFACAYFALRLLLFVLTYPDWRGVRPNPYTLSIVVTGPLFVLGALLPDPYMAGLWAAAALAELAGVRVLRDQLARVRFDTAHLVERYGLLLLIALGESLAQVGLAAAHHALRGGRVAALVAAFVLFGGLWWAYFVFAIRGVDRAFQRSSGAQTDLIRPVLSWAHLPLVCGIIAAAVGASQAVAAPAHPLTTYDAGLLAGGIALYFATFGYARWRLFHSFSVRRPGLGLLCLGTIPLARVAPALAVLLFLATIVVALNVVEDRIVARSGVAGLWSLHDDQQP